MKITLLEPLGIPEKTLSAYAARLTGQGHEFIAFDTRTADPEELLRRTGDSEIAVIANTPYPDGIIRRAPQLKLLNVAFTGIDHVGQEACRERGILLCNAAGYSTPCVAELAVGLTLDCLRFLSRGDRALRAGQTSAGLRGREIRGKTVGIVGTGAIGTETARLFLAFGARVIAFSRTERPEVRAMGVEYLPLETLMAQSDIVSLHVPVTPQTRGMISAEQLARMKPTALLINTARGPVVDNAALALALKEGRIAGAGIDVFDVEPPLPAEYPLLGAKNAVLTPHVAFLTDESMLRRAEIVFANIDAFLAGKPQNVCKL